MKMNKWLWYGLVMVAVWLLIISFVDKSSLHAIIALFLALILKTQYRHIPLPKAIAKHARR